MSPSISLYMELVTSDFTPIHWLFMNRFHSRFHCVFLFQPKWSYWFWRPTFCRVCSKRASWDNGGRFLHAILVERQESMYHPLKYKALG